MRSILPRVPAASGSPTDVKLSPTSSPETPTSRPSAAVAANDVLANPSRYVAINYIAKLSVVDLGIAFTNTRINFSLFYWCCCWLLLHSGGFCKGCITKRILLLQAFHSQENQYYADYDKQYYIFH
jgi:hypothetical protein